MLDEPTNHLDMHSVELLIEALNKYEGSIVLVSHDRYFISRIANKIWEIEDHKIVEFKGSYAEWEDWKERREAEAKRAGNETKNAEAEVKKNDPKPVSKEPVTEPQPAVQKTGIDKELKKEYQKYKNQFQQTEEKLAKLNSRKLELEALMASPEVYADRNKFQQTETDYKTVNNDIILLNKEYETVFEKVMELEEKLGV